MPRHRLTQQEFDALPRHLPVSRVEAITWLWQNDPNGEFDDLSKRDANALIEWIEAGEPEGFWDDWVEG